VPSPWSPKQQSFIKHSNAFINLAHGAVRSGKTHSNLIRFTAFCRNGPPGRLGIFGKTERTVKENVILPLISGLPPGAVKHTQGMGEVTIMGRSCRIFTANDARAVEKVQGSTLAGGYMNESTLYPEELFNMAISRSLTIENAKWFLDCNPDSPYHWLYEKFIQANHPSSYFKDWPFRITDNPILPAANVEMLKALYGGPGTLFYRRYIDGEWVMAEGAIYDMLDITPGGAHVVKELPPTYERVIIGVDYGTSNPTVFLALGKYQGLWYVFSEHRYDASGQSQRTDWEHSQAFMHWVDGLGYRHSTIEVDPSAASFKLQLRKDGVKAVRDANNDVLDGIRSVASALTTGTLKIHESCQSLLTEMSTYAWDSKKQEVGEDAPLKVNDHGCDALRYAGQRAFGRRAQGGLRVVR
jgi:PBSX family phage terminase large subunit